MDREVLFQNLTKWGCAVDEAMGRFLNDEELYEECLNAFSADEAFDKLDNHLNAGEFSDAFDDAHTLKGVAANLGLTPLLNDVSNLVERLRAENYEGWEPFLEKIQEEKKTLLSFLK